MTRIIDFSDGFTSASEPTVTESVTKLYDWVSEQAYTVGELVEYSNNSYRCITANSDVTFTEGKWDLVNGNRVSSTQDIASGGTMSLIAQRMNQVLKVQGDGGAQTASVTPFGTTATNFKDGMEVTLLGLSNSNTVSVAYSNDQYGCWVNGNIILSQGVMLTLVYSSDLERFIEKCRNT